MSAVGETPIKDLTPFPEAFEAAIEADRRYFQDHPSAWHYVRRRSLGEVMVEAGAVGQAEPGEHTLVVQLAPGVRCRTTLVPRTDVSDAFLMEALARGVLAMARDAMGFKP